MNRYRVVKADDHFYAQKLTIFGWGSMTSLGNVWCDDWKYDPHMTGHLTVENAIKRLIAYANRTPTRKNPRPQKIEVVTQFKNKKAIKEFGKAWTGEW